jgi:predicted ATPase
MDVNAIAAGRDFTEAISQTISMAGASGRDEETDLLADGSRPSGDGCVVLISGEPGIGKSRIAQTLVERLADKPNTRLRYFCFAPPLGQRAPSEHYASQFPDIVAAQPQLLVQHSAEAGLNEKAISYCLKAGQQAIAHSAMAEAVAQLLKALDLVDGARRKLSDPRMAGQKPLD